MEIKIITENSDFQKLEKDWNSALSKSGIENIFLTFDWVYSWWQHLNNGNRLFIIVVSEGCEVIGIMPLMLSLKSGFRQLSFISAAMADYEDIITTGDSEARERIIGVIIDRIYESKEWDALRLKGIKRNSPNFIPLNNICLKKNVDISLIAHKDGAPYLPITGEWDEYRLNLKKRFLADTKRQMSRFKGEYKLNFLEPGASTDVPALLEKLIELHITRYRALKARSVFENSAVASFFKSISHTFFDKGWLSLNYLTLDNEIATIHLGFKKDNKLYYYIPVFSDRFRQYSIGRLLLFDVVQKAFNNKFKEFDFMLGEEDYKMNWSPNIEPLYFFNMHPKTIMGYLAYLRFERLNIGIKKMLGKKW